MVLIPAGLDATLVLVRHGETEYIAQGRFQGHAPTPLTPLGERQATAAGMRLSRPLEPPSLPVPAGPPRAVVYSPLVRTTQTAERIGAALATMGIPTALVAERGLAEIAQGAWEGLLHDEVVERYGEVLRGWRRAPTETQAPGGERLVEVQTRVRNALERMLGELARGRAPGLLEREQVAGYARLDGPSPWTILVGHDGCFKVLLLTLLDLPLDRFWSFSLPLAGISVIEIRGGRPIVRAQGLTDHLAAIEAEQHAHVEGAPLGGPESREDRGAL